MFCHDVQNPEWTVQLVQVLAAGGVSVVVPAREDDASAEIQARMFWTGCGLEGGGWAEGVALPG